MKYTKLGRTGLDCSRLGFGTWQIGGERWKGLDAKDSVSLLHHAVEEGVNTFDAAIVYGQYRSELNERRSHALELLGQAFGGGKKREEVIICLKLGQLDEMSHRAIYQPQRMVEELNRALKELKTDYVDICLVHAPSIHEVKDGRSLSVVQTIQAMGKARFTGYSFEAEPEHARIAMSQGIDVMMFQYNLLDEECESIFDLAHDYGIGCLIGGPFKRGYLTGRFDKTEDLPLEDHYWSAHGMQHLTHGTAHMSVNEFHDALGLTKPGDVIVYAIGNLGYSRDKVEETLAKVAALKQKAGGAQQLRKQCLQHILKHPAATAAIVGHRAKDEVTENALAVHEIINSLASAA